MTGTETIADLAADLCDPHHHTEPIHHWDHNRHRKVIGHHRTTQPGLLQQLADAAHHQALNNDTSNTASHPGSRPPGNFDAIARHAAISIATVRWCWTLGVELRDTTEANIRALVGAAPTLDNDTRTALAAEMRTWRNQAATLTGWATPPITVREPCPICGHHTLLIQPARQTAMCRNTDCDTTWDEQSIGVLARHMEAHRAAVDATAKAARARAVAQRRAEEEIRSGRHTHHAA